METNGIKPGQLPGDDADHHADDAIDYPENGNESQSSAAGDELETDELEDEDSDLMNENEDSRLHGHLPTGDDDNGGYPDEAHQVDV